MTVLWRDPDSLTLIDTGLAGSGPDITRAIIGFGLTVMAHHREAPIIRGQVPGPPPVLTDDEHEFLAAIVGDGLPRHLRRGSTPNWKTVTCWPSTATVASKPSETLRPMTEKSILRQAGIGRTQQ
jgi:predicted RNA binding protein YcfA (HicA-like mRNA interferase family)